MQREIIAYALEQKLGDANLLNVNIPMLPLSDIKGIKVCRQAQGNWTEEFLEAKDPRGQSYYWMSGEFHLETDDTDTDIWALNNGFVSVVPSMHDLTHHTALSTVKGLENSNNGNT